MTPARAVFRTLLHSPISLVPHSLRWLKIEQRIQYKIIFITRNLLHRLFNIQPTRSTRFSIFLHFVCPIRNLLLDSNSPIDLFVMLYLLFETNYLLPFVPSPQKQLMPTQYHSHHPSFHLHRSNSCQPSAIPTICLISSTSS